MPHPEDTNAANRLHQPLEVDGFTVQQAPKQKNPSADRTNRQAGGMARERVWKFIYSSDPVECDQALESVLDIIMRHAEESGHDDSS